MGHYEGRVEGTIASLSLLVTPLLAQPRTQLAFRAASAAAGSDPAFYPPEPQVLSSRLLSVSISPRH